MSDTVPCPDCGVSGESSDSGDTHWQCDSCGRGYYLRRCADCREVGYVAVPHGWHQTWFCTWCATPNLGFTQEQDPAAATVAELAMSVARSRLSFALAKDVQAVIGEPGPPAPSSAVTAPEPERSVPDVPVTSSRSPRRRTILTVAACVLAVIAITTVWAAMRLDLSPSAPSRDRQPARPVSVAAAHVTSVIFQGVPGTLSVVGASTTRVSLTGQLRWKTRPPVTSVRFSGDGHQLLLSYRCAAASACTENFRLTVPYGEVVEVSQSSARITLTGLTGAVSVRAANVSVSATALRTTALVASITSGTLTASFDVAPALVDVTLMSAQGTLRLPSGVRYQVSQQVADGTVAVAVPQGGAANRVIARVTSAQLRLLPS